MDESFVSLGETNSIKRNNEDDQFVSLTSKKVVENAAQSFYNKSDKARSERKLSPAFHLRLLNNWIKHVLIKSYCQSGSRVLDLACGKGGDLEKWKESLISQYVGVDIADGSIKDAIVRYKEMKNVEFPARFAIGNLGKCDLSEFLQYVLFS